MSSPGTYINDEFIKALIDVTDERFSKIDLSKLLIIVIDYAPKEFLYELAKQYDVNGIEWELADTDAKKQELIKNSVKLHKHKGTFYAVKRILAILNIDGEIQEYDKYNGRKHHFKISMDIVNDSFDLVKAAKLIKLLDDYKPLRSKLDNFQINIVLTCNICLSTYMVLEHEVYIPDYKFNPLIFSDFYGEAVSLMSDTNENNPLDGYFS